jgi:hypothetical protein
MDEIFVVGVFLLGIFFAGSICGIIALVKQRKLRTRLQVLENALRLLRTQSPATEKLPAAGRKVPLPNAKQRRHRLKKIDFPWR